MNQPRYEVRVSTDHLNYLFVSEGPKGRILKVVSYSYLSDLDFWNLGFGDYDVSSGHVDDQVITDNGDGRKVLATVIFTLTSFFTYFPGATVIFTGSTERRTQIYGRIIRNYLADFSADFVVKGLDESMNGFPFDSTRQFSAFTIERLI